MKLLRPALLLLLVGCASTFLPLSVHVKEFSGKSCSVRVIGENIPLWQIETIIKALNRLNPPMLVEGLAIHIRDDQEHFGKTWNGLQVCGHRCFPPIPKICLLRNWVTCDFVWHETAHVYHGWLDRCGEKFSGEWLAAAGDVYDKDKNGGARNGLLTTYSHVNYREDVAEWIGKCYPFLNESICWEDSPVLKTDVRYRQKLALLHKYNFFSDDDYKKLKPLFQ